MRNDRIFLALFFSIAIILVISACGDINSNYISSETISDTVSNTMEYSESDDGIANNDGDTEISEDCIEWVFNDGVLTISGNGRMTDYAYRDDRPWNEYMSEITTVVIERGITYIGMNSFADCRGITSVTIPDSVIDIGARSFVTCVGLVSITIPDSVVTIGDSAFYDCRNLLSITIPEAVTTIDNYAFSDCENLTAVTIPSSVVFIGDKAFVDCRKLSSVTINNGEAAVTIGDGAFPENCVVTFAN